MQDFAQHNEMTWDFTNAGPGFVVLGAELAATSGTIALAFAAYLATAGGLTGQSLAAGINAARAAMTSAWQQWSASGQLPPLTAGDPPSLPDALRQSATILRVHQDHVHPGATVAGLFSRRHGVIPATTQAATTWCGRGTPSNVDSPSRFQVTATTPNNCWTT